MPDLPDKNTLTVAGIIAAALIAQMQLLQRKLKTFREDLEVYFGALAERSRRRDSKRRRRESQQPVQHNRRSTPRDAVPTFEADDENTDMHELIELEREWKKQRRTERPPRPGTRSDKPYEED